jgi:hypothetical protein
MSIDDMTTTHLNFALGAGVSVSAAMGMGTWAGVGAGADVEQDMLDIEVEVLAKTNLAVSTDRVSSTHYEYSFTFTYDFSTSADPNLAGHPSDVIIGGGLDLIVSEAIKGQSVICCNYYTFSSFVDFVCFCVCSVYQHDFLP